MNDDAMATSKLAEGIRGFAADIVKLETTVRERLGVAPAPTPTPTTNPDASLPPASSSADGASAVADMSEFDQLATMTTIVADSGEIEAIRKYKPTDATTNPSLIYAAAQMPEYQSFVEDAVQHAIGLEGEVFMEACALTGDGGGGGTSNDGGWDMRGPFVRFSMNRNSVASR